MCDRKMLHIISHTHWDREWYMSFEKHRAKLVEMVDDLLELLDKDPNFKSFHFDGQIVPLEDYLEIRPQMKNKLTKYINEGRIFIGPWYVLQDEYLISAESNVRNMLIGLRESKKYGNPTMVGYFPDSFGNISQVPQILRGFGIKSCAIGRFDTEIHFDNEIHADDTNPSEYIWVAPDGSEVLEIRFAHWYNNAMEIPSDYDAAVEKLKKIIDSTKYVAQTPHLLGMNGCDHQPVQANLIDIINRVRDAFPDVDIIHSNFMDYTNEVAKFWNNIPRKSGEAFYQNTDGYFTLINTASSRLYMKQANHRNQLTLEKQTEPLSVISYSFGDQYREDLINYSWKQMLKNHAHDSICGCSVDEVHRECMSRFEKSTAVAESVRDSAIDFIASRINTQPCEKAITVYNPNGYEVSQNIVAFADVSKDDYPVSCYALFDSDGNAVNCDIEDLGINFTYTLPRDSFRRPHYARRLKLEFSAQNVGAVGFKTYYLRNQIANTNSKITLTDFTAENDFIKVSINPNGTFNLYDKINKNELCNLGYFEESGDCGDEYYYRIPKNDSVFNTLESNATVDAKLYKTKVVFTVKNTLNVPETTNSECRSGELCKIKIKSTLTIGENSRSVKINTEIDNLAKNHRLRVMFPNDIKTDVVFVDGHFDLLERSILPTNTWKNPDYSQRQQNFLLLKDAEKSLCIANMGLPEYEVLRDGKNTVSLTVLRCIGELGDWGVFPTPEAQCIGKNIASYAVSVGNDKTDNIIKEAVAFSTGEMLSFQVSGAQDGNISDCFSFVKLDSKYSLISAVKKSQDDGDIIVRIYNPTDIGESVLLSSMADIDKCYISNLNEEMCDEILVCENTIKIDSPAKKITSLKLKLV